MYLYLMRHGETDWNKAGKIQGSADIPLNQYGEFLALETKKGLKKESIVFDIAYTSPYKRALSTTNLILEGSVTQVHCDDRLKEMSFGEYEGIFIRDISKQSNYKNIANCFSNPTLYIADRGAESYETVLERVSDFLEKCVKPRQHQVENMLVVCHGALIRAFLCLIKGLELKDYWSSSQPNCAINKILVEQDTFTLVEEGKIFYEKASKIADIY